jgi:hypothetical protein
MRAGRAARWAVVAAFSAAVGHLAWHALAGPPATPHYLVGGDGPALLAPDPEAKQVYLRRKLYLAHRPRHAWIRVVARDRVQVFVNGMPAGTLSQDGFPVAIVADLTPLMQAGPNVIAVASQRASVGPPPAVAVEGACVVNQQVVPLRADASWRSATALDRVAGWWFSPEFKDGHWPYAQTATEPLRAKLFQPPRATSEPDAGRWITPETAGGRSAAVRREFEVAGRPEEAWVRVTATASYRLAVNGILIDEQEGQAGTALPVVPARRSYDISTIVRPGRNVVALWLSSNAGPPHVLADLEVTDRAGGRVRVATDESWRGRPGPVADWPAPDPVSPADWAPCRVEWSDMGVPPWKPAREFVAIDLPAYVDLMRAGGQLALMAGAAALTLGACAVAGRLVPRPSGSGPKRPAPAGVVYLALVPATLAIAAALLAMNDPRFAPQEVYQRRWVALAVASVPLQWVALALAARLGGAADHRLERRRGALAHVGLARALAVGLTVLGFWLRVRNIDAECIQGDETNILRATRGFFLRGFPSFEVAEGMPPVYVSTSELVYVGTALASLVFDKATWIIRFPAVCWGTLTILLIYRAGRRMFGSAAVGLVAAAIYALSPQCIQTTNFGRYFSQVQFFALLAVELHWRTLAGTGPIDRRSLWRTGVAFLLMYLTWEGSALIAAGMVVAALVQRRGRLRTILAEPQVWAAMAAVGMVVIIQLSNRTVQLTERVWYGSGASDVELGPMWRYPDFDPWYYVWEACWNQDTLLPMLGLLGSVLLAIRHGFRRPARFLLCILLTTCLIQALLLTLKESRYSYHLVPLPILLASATVVAGTRRLARLGWSPGQPSAWRAYSEGLAALAAAAFIALASGLTIETPDLQDLRSSAYRIRDLKFSDMRGPARYLREHLREGDVIITSHPHIVDHLLPGRASDYWLQSRLQLQAVLDDSRPLPLHRLSGTVMVASLDALEDLLARSHRVWYLVDLTKHDLVNDADVTAELLEHMTVVYEDYSTLVLTWGDAHRTAWRRRVEEKALQQAGVNFLQPAE